MGEMADEDGFEDLDIPAALSSDERDVFLSTHTLPSHDIDFLTEEGEDITFFLESVDNQTLALLRDILDENAVPADILTTIVMDTVEKEHGNDIMFNACLLARLLRRAGGIPVADEEFEARGSGFVSVCLGLVHNYSPSHKEPMPRIQTREELEGAAGVIRFIGAIGRRNDAIKFVRSYYKNGNYTSVPALTNQHLDRLLRANPLVVRAAASYVRTHGFSTTKVALDPLRAHLESKGYEVFVPSARKRHTAATEPKESESEPFITDAQIARALKRGLKPRNADLFEELKPELAPIYPLLRKEYGNLKEIAGFIGQQYLTNPEIIRGRIEGTRLPRSAEYLLEGDPDRDLLVELLTEGDDSDRHRPSDEWMTKRISALRGEDVVVLTNAVNDQIIDPDACRNIIANNDPRSGVNTVRECVLLAKALPEPPPRSNFVVEVVNGLRHSDPTLERAYDALDMSTDDKVQRYAAVARAILYYDENALAANTSIWDAVRNRRTSDHRMKGQQLREDLANLVMDHPKQAELIMESIMFDGTDRGAEALARLHEQKTAHLDTTSRLPASVENTDR